LVRGMGGPGLCLERSASVLYTSRTVQSWTGAAAAAAAAAAVGAWHTGQTRSIRGGGLEGAYISNLQGITKHEPD